MKRIDVSTPKYPNTFTIVDDVDFERLNKFKWSALEGSNTVYAQRCIRLPNGKWSSMAMHREILGLKHGDKRQGDHRNHNGLNNRQGNLRICTRSQNHQNKCSKRNSSSDFKGVFWSKNNHKWQVEIQVNGHNIYLGLFNSEIIAAQIYDKAAKKYFSEFAYLNFPDLKGKDNG